MRTVAALVLVLAFVFSGCRADRAMVSADTSSGVLVDVAWLVDAADREDVVVLHAGRDSTSYNQGHIPGARFLPLEAVAVNRGDQVNVLPEPSAYAAAMEAAGVSDNSHVVVYGDLNGLAATRVFAAMDAFGHERVAVLDGGRDAWASAGNALSTERTTARSGSLSPRVRDGIIVSAAEIESLRQASGTVLIDARPPAQHSGEDPGENITRPGHIPGSVNLFWEDDLTDAGTLLPRDTLRTRYADAGATSAVEVITYCRTGMQASHAYFVARYLGLQPRLYDGSFHDWSNNTNYPVARL